MIRSFEIIKKTVLMKKEVKPGMWLCVDTDANKSNALLLVELITERINEQGCKVVLKGAIYDNIQENWIEWNMSIDCLTEANQLHEYFQGNLLDSVRTHVDWAISEYECEFHIKYGVYNGATPIFTNIEDFDTAQEVFNNTAKACDLLNLECSLINEKTGEVIR